MSGLLDENGYEALKSAGTIARQVREEVHSLVREGIDALTLSELIEESIRRRGGRPAFPCNIGVDSIAAHYTPTKSDNLTISRGSLVKVDIGVEVDGYIADTAVTVPLPGSDANMVAVAEEALRAALKSVRAGVHVAEIGRVVYSTVTRLGYRPIKNLTGHEIERYNLHAGVSIPNVPVQSSERLLEGHVYAIEPFVTYQNAAGEVTDSSTVNIFSVAKAAVKPTKLSKSELEFLERLKQLSRGLPYTLRWLEEGYEEIHGRLYKRGLIHGYPVLVEKSGAPVAQSEHTIIVRSDGCEIIT